MKILSRIESPKDLKKLNHRELAEVAQDCRDVIVETITKTGGHLASNLGVVELTLALHRAFESPKDWLVFDTSNQCYTHKLVTGRRDRFATIRTPGGLSGFSEPTESAHDSLAAGHAGTGLSYGLGIAMAQQNAKDDPYVVVHRRRRRADLRPELRGVEQHRPRQAQAPDRHPERQRLVDLGERRLARALAQPLRASSGLREVHPGTGHRFFKRLPKGDKAWELARKLKSSVEGLFFPNLIWDELGFHYVGPVDGHNFVELEDALARAREVSGRRHARGHPRPDAQGAAGFQQAEDNPSKFHQPGTPTGAPGSAPRYTYSQVFARTLLQLMEKDEKIVAISAAMLEGTALIEVKKKFPERVFDVGIAEEHAIIMAAGMAKAGWKPVVAIYSTFLQRSYDQLIHDVCLQNLPVTICVDRAGLVGDDGKTHQGIYDIAYTRGIPNMVVAAGKDENELQHLLYTAIYSGRPFTIRYPRGAGVGVPPRRGAPDPADRPRRDRPRGQRPLLRSPTARWCRSPSRRRGPRGDGASIAASPTRVSPSRSTGICFGTSREKAPRLLTLEEHLTMGGFGSGVLEAFHQRGLGRLQRFGFTRFRIASSSTARPPCSGRASSSTRAASSRRSSRSIRISGAQRPRPRPARGRREDLVETVTW